MVAVLVRQSSLRDALPVPTSRVQADGQSSATLYDSVAGVEIAETGTGAWASRSCPTSPSPAGGDGLASIVADRAAALRRPCAAARSLAGRRLELTRGGRLDRPRRRRCPRRRRPVTHGGAVVQGNRARADDAVGVAARVVDGVDVDEHGTPRRRP